MLTNVKLSMMFSVKHLTLQTYTSGWNHWLEFTKTFKFDHLLCNAPIDWPADSPYPFQHSAISSFITFSYFQLKLQPSTINSYLSGMKFYISNEGCDISFFNSRIVSSTRHAILIHFRSQHPFSESATYPFTLDLIHYCKTNLLSQHEPKDIATLIAIQLAFSCLMRISEYIDTESDHFLLSNDVFFLVIENNSDQHINCTDINSYHLDKISAVTITIRSSKNDPEGISNTLCFHKNVALEGSFDLCTSIYQWCNFAKPTLNIPFLYYLNTKIINTNDINSILKKAASENNLDPAHFTSKSLRSGGASILAAASLPSYLIQKIGRWKSLTFLQYIKISTEACNTISDALFNPNLLTISHIKQFYNTQTISVPSKNSQINK